MKKGSWVSYPADGPAQEIVLSEQISNRMNFDVVLQEVLDWRDDQVSGLEVYVDDLDDAVLLNEYIYFEKLPRNLYSQSIQSKFYQIFQWLELQDINEHVLILLMILVAVINMITAVLIFVLERTEMIGLLKSVGASDWSIRKIFLHNAAEVITEAEYYLDTVPIAFNWWMIIAINIGTAIITLLFMIIPTWIVSRVDPVRALRFS